jgi:hypothetical protein
MPNGEDKNLIRFLAAVDGFRARYNRWPTRVRLFPGALKDLEHILSPTAFRALTTQLTLVPDPKAAMIAEDDEGGRYHYGQEGFPSMRPKPNAWEWLGSPGLR